MGRQGAGETTTRLLPHLLRLLQARHFTCIWGAGRASRRATWTSVPSCTSAVRPAVGAGRGAASLLSQFL